jgi:hypothetical protein
MDVCQYVVKLGFTNLSGTAWRITLRLIADEEFFIAKKYIK